MPGERALVGGVGGAGVGLGEEGVRRRRRRGCWVVFSTVMGLGEGRGGGIHNGRQCYGLLQI